MNILSEIKQDLRAIILPAFGQDIPLAVIETIEALWADGKRPQIHDKKKNGTGYVFTLALPRDVCFKDFLAKRDYFRDACGGNKVNIDISQSGSMAIMRINKDLLGEFFDYPDTYPKEGILPVPVGYSTKGLEIIDLSLHEHILIGGETGSGKTTCLLVIIYSLLWLPNPPLIVVIDLKRSGDYSNLKDKVMLIQDRLTAKQALERLLQETYSRQQMLSDTKCKDIIKYNKKIGGMSWIVLIIDELAQLKSEEAQETLEDLLALSRAAGVRIISATQRPSSKIFKAKSFGDAKSNFTIRICYGVMSAVDSRVILDSGEGATLPKIPGRGILRIGRDLTEIQTPYLEVDDEFPQAMFSKKREANRIINRVGVLGHTPNKITAISFIAGCTEKIKSIIRAGKN